LASTDYGDFLANETVLEPKLIEKKCTEKLANEFFHIRNQASQPLAKFLDYITYVVHSSSSFSFLHRHHRHHRGQELDAGCLLRSMLTGTCVIVVDVVAAAMRT